MFSFLFYNSIKYVYINIFRANYATYDITFINLYVVVNIAHFSYAIKEVIPNMKDEHKEEYKRLGLNIAYYRKAKGLSQIQLSDKINVSRTHMSRIENNDCAVMVSTETTVVAFNPTIVMRPELVSRNTPLTAETYQNDIKDVTEILEVAVADGFLT